MDVTLYALGGTAVATAVVHTLIPDHWLPFVLIGRSRRWPTRTVAFVSGLSALIHTGLSFGLGLAALGIGVGVAEAAGATLERAGALLLVLFGVGYAGWAWRKGGHFHPGGALVHGGANEACAGDEGPAHPEHLHYHADKPMIDARARWGRIGLAVIVGVNPCVLMLPLLLAAAPRGAWALGLVGLAYGLPTIALMVALSVLGVRTAQTIRLPAPARQMEAASGLLIAALGLLYWLTGS